MLHPLMYAELARQRQLDLVREAAQNSLVGRPSRPVKGERRRLRTLLALTALRRS